MANPPQTEKIANKVDTSMAYRYRRAFELELKSKSDDFKKCVEAAKSPAVKCDREVSDFFKSVIAIAESDREL